MSYSATSFLDTSPHAPTLTSVWPEDGGAMDLNDTLAATGNENLAKDIAATLRSLKSSEKLSKHPILAITGQLNAGKSSVIASFLSDSGRARVPRGSSSLTGTHRFVYWVPQHWLDNSDYRALLLDLIATAHPAGVEFLDSDPEIAAEQYRSGRDDLSTLSTPLIAGDPQLDTLGAGLLDCPDIQTHDSDSAAFDTELTESHNPRLEFLTSASRVCSAFLVVWTRSAIRDRLLSIMLSALRKRMAAAPFYLLINMIRPEEGQPQLTLQDSDVTRLLEQFGIAEQQIYGAFDFAIEDRDERPGWRHFTPTHLVEKFNQAEAPQFYPLAQGIQTKEDLHSLSQSLDTAEIQRIKIENHHRELATHLKEASQLIRLWVNQEELDLREKHDGLLNMCHDLMIDESTGEPLQIMSPEFSEALHQSLVRTAPMAIKLSLKIAKPFDRASHSAKKFIRSLNLKSFSKDKLESLGGKLKQDLNLGPTIIARSDLLARRMQTQRWCPPHIAVSDLEKGWDETFKIFQNNPIESFDTQLLDTSSKHYWDGLPLIKKFTTGGKALLGALGGLAAVGGIATLAVDGGATFYAATSISHAINSSIALAVAAGGAGTAIVSFGDSLLRDNTLPYLSRLFSIACDCFRLPRQFHDEPSQVSFKTPKGNTISHKLSHSPELKPSAPITPLSSSHIWKQHKT